MKYKTKQRDTILEHIKLIGNNHFTVNSLVVHLANKGINIGTTTIYRNLELLVNEGILNKYIIDNNTSACYEYNSKNETSYHFKCEVCNKLIHIETSELKTLEKAIKNKYDFSINPYKTVFYGRCKECQNA